MLMTAGDSPTRKGAREVNKGRVASAVARENETREATYNCCGVASGPDFAGAYPRLLAGARSVQQHAGRHQLRFLLLPRAMRSLMRKLLYRNGSYPASAS
jgi:hypothetical protein